jgi:hypothetical protein
MVAPISRAVFADMTTCTPQPMLSMKPDRVEVVGRDISFGSRPLANSATELLVAFMLANS